MAGFPNSWKRLRCYHHSSPLVYYPCSPADKAENKAVGFFYFSTLVTPHGMRLKKLLE